MHYAITAIIFSLLLTLSPHGLASNDNILSSPMWLNVTPNVHLDKSQQAMYFEAKQSRYLWLAKGQWLELDSTTFNKPSVSYRLHHITAF